MTKAEIELRDLKRHVESLGSALRHMADSIALTSQQWNINYCVDYYDLRKYLTLRRSPNSADEDDALDPIDAYVHIQLFQALSPVPILLPSYYQELKEDIWRMFDRRGVEKQQFKSWLRQMRLVIRREAHGNDGLVAHLHHI